MTTQTWNLTLTGLSDSDANAITESLRGYAADVAEVNPDSAAAAVSLAARIEDALTLAPEGA